MTRGRNPPRRVDHPSPGWGKHTCQWEAGSTTSQGTSRAACPGFWFSVGTSRPTSVPSNNQNSCIWMLPSITGQMYAAGLSSGIRTLSPGTIAPTAFKAWIKRSRAYLFLKWIESWFLLSKIKRDSRFGGSQFEVIYKVFITASTLPDSLQTVLFSPAQKHEWRSGSWGGSAVGPVDPGCLPECRLHQRHKIKVALPALLSRLRREEAQVNKSRRPGELSPGLKVHAGFMKYQFTA